ncbi:hypothetical protein ABB37_09374 [Leptomonas pyrrhocoris]|uniref:PH domain-containing protein n=1 Tax=Leptomonas pyrrhocoris TaxID=157538 RepID=A0A0N1J487_LEPPY|nr:hypothetical protein ABB37_09374 [Leptomonas pyrrhocoris]KPA74074.1 hypothetical protein ABB37_09374 [Leptomonas pyrrhocoris]|eukprot:XP_015652513.1 hypothetical protein ABB37_09374 [Leptomonas pyrrhocoris]
MGEERAPLLCTTDLVAPETQIALDDGVYSTPQEISRGVTYTGSVTAHTLSGDGCLTCARGSYSGTFHQNKLTGNGRFSGGASADTLRSTGVATSPSDVPRGAVRVHGATTSAALAALSEAGLDPTTVVSYDGEWRNGVPHGHGVMRWDSGDTYEGLFDGGQPHGSGSGSNGGDGVNAFTFADGSVYTGEFDHGLRNGRGKIVLPNGDVYDGQFVRGTVTGFGTITYENGPRVYRGLLENGRKIKGTLRFPGSLRGYDGEWQDDVPHGSGCMTFANGDFYKGDFAAGELNGVGCLCYQHPAGKVYYGQFLRGQPCGRGYIYEPEATQSADSLTEPPVAKVTESYFQSGQAVQESETAVRDAVVEATRGLRMPEATPPSYSTLLQQRPVTTTAAEVAIPLLQVENDSAATAFGSGVTSSSPAGNSMSTSHPKAAEDGGEADEDEEEEVSLSAAGDDVDVDVEDAEAEKAVAGSDGSPDTDLAAMPPLTSAQDGSCCGWLAKCSIGRHNLSLISTWKRRYFILALCNDSVCLGYYQDEQCRKPVGFIRLNTTDTRIVTCPTTKTHKKASRPGRDLCVIYHEDRKEYKLLLRAHDATDHDRWAIAFRSFFLIVDRPSDHPMHAFQS